AETIGLAKALTIGAGYQVSVGAAMNTTVGLSQSEQVGVNKSEIVGNRYSIHAEEEFRIQIGKSVLLMKRDGTVLINGHSFNFSASGPANITGSEVDLNLREPIEQSFPTGPFIAKFSLMKPDDQVYAGYHYTISNGNSILQRGITQANGETDWLNTEVAEVIHIKKAKMREDQKITEQWLSRLQMIFESPPAESLTLDEGYLNLYDEEQ
ncbi:type VI secretion system tip protein VgrG, partial [Pseudomonas sp. S60]|nr:type VI secretion system tip protein VgrG [Pseudomonas sp. S60]